MRFFVASVSAACVVTIRIRAADMLVRERRRISVSLE